MTKRMLIDASHPEETRLVVMDGNKVEDFDVEAADRLPLKGNIYLAKIVRVEPSLQAAFVEYGGNRHGFLAFSEIHPDYYQIPVADRQRILEMQAQEAEYEDDDEAELDTAAERVAPSDDRDLSNNGQPKAAENGGREGREGRERRGGRGRGRDRNRNRAAASAEGEGESAANGDEETPNTAGRDPFGDETPLPAEQDSDTAGRDALDEERAVPAGRDAFEGDAAGGDESAEGRRDEPRGGGNQGEERQAAPAADASGEHEAAKPAAGETPNTAGRDPFGDETPLPAEQDTETAGRDTLDEHAVPPAGQPTETAGRDAFEGGAAGGERAAARSPAGTPGPAPRPADDHADDTVSEGDPVAEAAAASEDEHDDEDDDASRRPRAWAATARTRGATRAGRASRRASCATTRSRR